MEKLLIRSDLYDKSGWVRRESLIFGDSSGRLSDSALGSPEIAP